MLCLPPAQAPESRERGGEGQPVEDTVCWASPDGLGVSPGHHALTASLDRDMQWGHEGLEHVEEAAGSHRPRNSVRAESWSSSQKVNTVQDLSACSHHLLEAGQAAVGL